MSELRWVLVAEDDEDVRQMIRTSLLENSAGMNLQIVEAKDGIDAITKASAREFACVVTDLRMPRSTGEDLLRALQNQPLNANTPTLVVSGHADNDSFKNQFAHVKVFPKPFLPEDIARAVTKEIKLGRIDDRIAVHLINPFVEVVNNLLNADLKLKSTLQPPTVKKPSEDLPGDFHCTLTLSVGLSRARFTLSFEKSLLEHIKVAYLATQIAKWSALTPDATARYFCQVIFEKVGPELSKVLNGNVRLTRTAIVCSLGKDANSIEYAELVRTSGITVSMNTDQGRVIAGAYAKAKSNRI